MATLIYIHDPMCSWCWGFNRTLKEVIAGLPPDIEVRRLLGGLAKDSDEPMSLDMKDSLQSTWKRIETDIPWVQFNFDFWKSCKPRRSTYISCRAVVAARQQGNRFDEGMTRAIQQAYYEQAQNPSDETTLIQLATEIGLDVGRFTNDLRSKKTQDIFLKEMAEVRSYNVHSFPYLLLKHNGETHDIPIIYTGSNPILKLIEKISKESH